MSKKLLAGPYLLWMAGFIIIPLALIVYYGVTDKSGGKHHVHGYSGA